MEFLQNLTEYVNSGDPVVRTFPLVRQTYAPFLLCGCYALFSTVLGPALMKNRKPFDLRKVLIVFNFAIVSVYSVCILIMCFHLRLLTFEEFCLEAHVKVGEVTYKLVKTGWWIYFLKYVEFFDTVFFILRKKNHLITFLHVVHHTVVPILAWFIARTEKNGFMVIPLLLNSFVHIIMYTYYGLAAMGPEVRKHLWWKKYLTQMQIVQFVMILIAISVVSPLLGCSLLRSSRLLSYFFGPFFIVLFLNYYMHSFVSSSQKTHTLQNGKEK